MTTTTPFDPSTPSSSSQFPSADNLLADPLDLFYYPGIMEDNGKMIDLETAEVEAESTASSPSSPDSLGLIIDSDFDIDRYWS